MLERNERNANPVREEHPDVETKGLRLRNEASDQEATASQIGHYLDTL